LAYKAGKLTGKQQSRIQRWALGYYQYADKRDRADSEYEIKKLLHLILRGTNNKLYDFAFPSPEVNDPDVIPGHTYGVDDLEGLEKLLSKIDGLSTRTQADLNDEWSEWR
jgi:hypothetical protein